MLPDSSELDAALVARLQTDPTLVGLLQPGACVFVDVAPPGSKKFVIVSVELATDAAAFDDRSFEDVLYLVEARMLSTAGGNIKAAAKRIDELLEGQPLTIPGYTLMTLHREERIRDTEPDDLDPAILWNRRGGKYRLVAST